MANVVVLRDIRNTLKQLIKENIDDLSDEGAVIFDSPGDIDNSTTTRLTAFLYHIIENTHMRNTQPTYPGYTQKQYSPLTLDLYFLFVPYAQDREKEIIVLEQLMRTFHDNAVLRGDILQGGLSLSGNDEIRIEPHTLSLDDLNKLWSTFPNKALKLSKSYIITPVHIPSEVIEDVSRGAETIITSSQIDYP